MADTDKGQSLRRRRRGRIGLWTIASVFLVFMFFGFAALSLTGRSLVVPAWITGQIETRLSDGLGGGALSIRRTEFTVDRQGVPRVILRNVELRDPSGASLAQINQVGAGLSMKGFLQGQFGPAILRVSGAQVTLRRDETGQFSLQFGDGAAQTATVADLLARLDAAFAETQLAGTGRIEVRDLTITLEDARSGRLWQATGGRLTLTNSPSTISINVFSEVFNGTEDLAQIQLSLSAPKGSGTATIGAKVEDAAAQDIALQSPVLSYLGVLDAPISGAIRGAIDSSGAVGEFAATLEIGQGALQPTPESSPIAFNSGQVYLTFDPDRQRIDFSQITVESDELRVVGEGHGYLRDFAGPWPGALLAQLTFSEIELAPEGIFAEAVAFDGATTDFRMRLAPFEIDIGQVSVRDGDARYAAKGTVAADSEGWSVGLDAATQFLTRDRLLQLWPVILAPKTRKWVTENVTTGEISNANAALRLAPGEPLRYGLSYDFDKATVRYLRHLPPVQGGRGHSAIAGDSFSVVVDKGLVTAKEGGTLDLAGTTFKVPNIRRKDEVGEIGLRTESSLTALLSVLDNPPFRVLERAGRPATIADARATFETHIKTLLKKGVPIEKVAYTGFGTLTDVRSDTLVPGRNLTATRLTAELDTGALRIFGPVRLDGLPLTISWTQPLTRGEAATSRITGEVEMSERFAETFGIDLPEGTVSGAGAANLELEVSRDAPITFALTSDLAGVALDIPTLRWGKPAETPGTLTITGRLGETPSVDRLEISGPGLAAEGTVSLTEAGGFGAVEFSRLDVGNWLKAAVRLEPEGEGKPAKVRVTGGAMDLRNLDLTVQRQSTDTGGGPISMALDRLIITDGISLAPFNAEINTTGGLGGTFEARVNGGAPIQGSLVPTPQGTAVRIISQDAGAVARDAGFLRTLAGGEMDMILRPREDAEGYDGQLRIRTVRLRDQPVIAALLDAISVVGILDQLNGPGIGFETMDARFRLTSKRLYLDQAAAVGPSLGISLAGVYDTEAGQMDMQGVISPIYLLNGIGQIFSRRGEGLFGFNFRMRGPSSSPRVTVNPLSILTPGMFREIFRSPPPGLNQ